MHSLLSKTTFQENSILITERESQIPVWYQLSVDNKILFIYLNFNAILKSLFYKSWRGSFFFKALEWNHSSL